ncbi:MAG: hypothetical protein FJ189_09755 [Gammaproteobacteria bacterium]|nr:hypothetical protein [Gammaproteobacteria bacterium]
MILKAQGSAGARVFYYSGQGVLSDGTLTATGTITSVSFCYGLTTYTPPPSANLPDCNELPPTSLGIGALDDTGIQCPSSSDERVLISLDPNAPNWNVTACSCNHTFRACDPNVPAGSPGACTTVGDTLEHVPVIIEAIEDPTYCTTSGGTRTCKTY